MDYYEIEEGGAFIMKTNDLIRMRRLELDMTMKELAAKVGVSEGTISRWESGDIENMKRDKIAALARLPHVRHRRGLRACQQSGRP